MFFCFVLSGGFLGIEGTCPLHVAAFGATFGVCGDFELGFSGGVVLTQRPSKVRAAGGWQGPGRDPVPRHQVPMLWLLHTGPPPTCERAK